MVVTVRPRQLPTEGSVCVQDPSHGLSHPTSTPAFGGQCGSLSFADEAQRSQGTCCWYPACAV